MAGTRAYAERFPAAEGHFRRAAGAWVSSLGLGSGGFPSVEHAELAARCEDAVEVALLGGINIIDSAANYGNGGAERIVGRALAELCASGSVRREELVLCTKAGYLAEPTAPSLDEIVRAGLCSAADVTPSGHCLAPAYLARRVDVARKNLGVETVDVFLLHNPEEQLEAVGSVEFERRVHAAFGVLEGAAAAGRIGCYGIASAEGFRTTGSGLHRLDRLVELAREVGGDTHRFKVIELPVNLLATEGLFLENHQTDGRPATVLEVAVALDIAVFASVALNRGRLPRPLPAPLRDVCAPLGNERLMALQFTRSSPGVSVALVGMSDPAHVRQNLELLGFPPVDLRAEYTAATG